MAVRLEVQPAAVTVESIGEQLTFTARVLDERGNDLTDVPVAWEAGDDAILEMVSPGVFRSKGVGSTVVRARVPSGVPGVDPGGYVSGDGFAGQSSVQVTQVAAHVQVTPGDAHLWAVGQRQQMQAEVTDALGTPMLAGPAVTWSSETPSVLSVDPTGSVVAVGDGTGTVTAQAAGVVGTADIQVSATITETICLTFSGGKSSEPQCVTIHLTATEHTP